MANYPTEETASPTRGMRDTRNDSGGITRELQNIDKLLSVAREAFGELQTKISPILQSMESDSETAPMPDRTSDMQGMLSDFNDRLRYLVESIKDTARKVDL